MPGSCARPAPSALAPARLAWPWTPDCRLCAAVNLAVTLPGGQAACPLWDRDRQQLRVGNQIVKQFKVPAINQEAVLAAFEEEGWPVRIDDPLAPQPKIDPKRRLHDTINALNRNQRRSLLRFSGDGSGQGVRWEFISQPSASHNA